MRAFRTVEEFAAFLKKAEEEHEKKGLDKVNLKVLEDCLNQMRYERAQFLLTTPHLQKEEKG